MHTDNSCTCRTIPFIFAFFCIVLFGDQLDTSAQEPKPPLSSEDAKKLISKAASIPNRDFREILTKGTTPGFKKLKSQPLSIVLMSIPAEPKQDSDGSQSDFVYLDKTPDPVELVKAMWRTKSEGYATIIQPGFITECTVKTKKSVASGTVQFTAKGLYSGKVYFTAQNSKGSWNITEFLLPTTNMKIVLNEKKEWKALPIESKSK